MQSSTEISFLLSCFIGFFGIKSNCEIFSAINELEKLAASERVFIKELEILAHELNDELVDRKLQRWKSERKLVESNVTLYITNPLNAYLMIKRSTADVGLIASLFPEQSQEFMLKIQSVRPSPVDLNGAVDGLLRLQSVYKFTSVDFANGIIDGRQTRDPLTAHDLFVIGEVAHRAPDQDYFAKEYLHLAWRRMKDYPEESHEVDENFLLLHLAELYSRTGDYANEFAITEELIKNNPDEIKFNDYKMSSHDDLMKYGTTKFKQRDPFSDEFIKDGEWTQEKEDIVYSQVCRRNITRSHKELAKLHCHYVSKTLFSKLAPFKVEEANLDPYIVLFVDVLSDSEIEFLIKISNPVIKRATVGWSSDKKISNQRVAQLSWHFDAEHEFLRMLAKRVEDMTGLDQTSAEAIQTQNYGIGGHYVPHWDHRIERDVPFEDGYRNRIATTLFYMTDVELGGETAFPYLKFLIPARKGAVAFWHNLRVSGQGDYSTKHAGCPIVLGIKWVANRWIREDGQEFRRLCMPETFEKTLETSYYQDFF